MKLFVSIIDCVETQSTGPFDDKCNKKLYSLVLEQSMIDNIVKNIQKIDEAGIKCLEEFETMRMSNQVKAFFGPINKNFKHLKGKKN